MKTKIAFLRNFVSTHRVSIAVGMTALAFVLLLMKNQKELNEFLEKHNLTEEFYNLND